MGWFKLDDGFFHHPKVVQAGRDARDLWLAAGCYCAKELTDGFVPMACLALLAAEAQVSGAARLVARLLEVGMLEQAPGGWLVHDYLSYNPSRAKVLAERAATARRLAAWRARKLASNGAGNAVTHTISNEGVTLSPYPYIAATPSEPPAQEETSVHDSFLTAGAPAGAREKKPTHSSSARGNATRRRALLVAFEDVDRFRSPANSVELAQRVAAARALLESTPPVTPAEVPRLVARWDTDHDPELCTPMALARNLTQLRGPPAKPNRRRSAVFRDDRTPAQKAVEPVRGWREVDWREGEATAHHVGGSA